MTETEVLILAVKQARVLASRAYSATTTVYLDRRVELGSPGIGHLSEALLGLDKAIAELNMAMLTVFAREPKPKSKLVALRG